jgi:hypothetical protein
MMRALDALFGFCLGCSNAPRWTPSLDSHWVFWAKGGLEIQDATLCTRERAAASVIAGWVRDSQDPVLIAIDAPLGWPKPLAETLINHSAGTPIETPANAMFGKAVYGKRNPMSISTFREFSKHRMSGGYRRP